jgi:uncharacterized protein
MYNLKDRTWRDQPGIMSAGVRDHFAAKVDAHAARHGLSGVHIILHGGEPLLMGRVRLIDWIERVRSIIRPAVDIRFSIQSNGILIDEDWIDALAAQGVRIGLSLDGPRRFHDAHRLDHKGLGSFDRVMDAIGLLRSHPRGPEIFSTVMAVVDPSVDPSEMFDFWQEIDVPGFDLSLPHANWSSPPPLKGDRSYGAWMVEFFDLWFDQNRPDRSVRYFENILRMIFGFPISTDNIGGRPVDVIVVETDGSIEPTDAFKSCFDGITKLGLSVQNNAFDDVSANPFVRDFQVGAKALCRRCKRCDIVNECGGGYMPHRYDEATGFANPSVYCSDLMLLINHIRGRVCRVLQHEGLMVEA